PAMSPRSPIRGSVSWFSSATGSRSAGRAISPFSTGAIPMFGDLLSIRDAARSKPRLRILIWALAICAFLGAIEAGEPLDDVFKAARDTIRSRPASGQIAVVGVD